MQYVQPVADSGVTTPAAGWSRQAAVTRLLRDALSSLATPSDRVATVLDCGGGSGSAAVPLALAGADVTVVDISVDALATLARRAGEAGVADRVHPVQADVETLDDAIGPDRAFDLVVAHGILESVDPLPAAFATIAAAVRAGGLLSVLVANPVAAVLARALGGDLTGAWKEFQALDGFTGAGGTTRVGPAAVHALCHEAGLQIKQVQGVGVFSEIVPGPALDSPGGRQALAALEDAASARSPFAEIASRVHLLAVRPG